jgi:ATP-binding cassette subfamily C (CFTR/MRP) protein 1
MMYYQMVFRLCTMIRGALVSALFDGMLSLRAQSGNASAGQALMSNDVTRIAISTIWVVSALPNVLQVCLALWILGTQLGVVCIAPVIVALRK